MFVFLFLGDFFCPDGNFCVRRVVGLCFTWKYYLYPHDLWWLFNCASLSWNHLLYRRTGKNKNREKEKRKQHELRAFKIWGLGHTCRFHQEAVDCIWCFLVALEHALGRFHGARRGCTVTFPPYFADVDFVLCNTHLCWIWSVDPDRCTGWCVRWTFSWLFVGRNKDIRDCLGLECGFWVKLPGFGFLLRKLVAQLMILSYVIFQSLSFFMYNT